MTRTYCLDKPDLGCKGITICHHVTTCRVNHVSFIVKYVKNYYVIL